MKKLVAAIPRSAEGPGWSNQPLLCVYVEHGEWSVEYVQPEDQPQQVRVLWPVVAVGVAAITRWYESSTDPQGSAGDAS